jgi:hypothetical protein
MEGGIISFAAAGYGGADKKEQIGGRRGLGLVGYNSFADENGATVGDGNYYAFRVIDIGGTSRGGGGRRGHTGNLQGGKLAGDGAAVSGNDWGDTERKICRGRRGEK